MIKKFFILFILTVMIFCSAYRKPDRYVIRAEKDAYYHNNVGLNYLKDRVYYAAIQEFKIAISLSPDTQSTAIFKNNLGETYMYIGYPDMAKSCFEDALELYGLNLKYYINLVNCYKELNLVSYKIKEFQSSNNPYDRIKLGLLYIECGQLRNGINTLDEFTLSNPDLIITFALKQYIKDIVSKK